jgi:hypothetical protein
MPIKIIYTERFPIINGGPTKKQAVSSFLSLRGMQRVPYNRRTFALLSGELEISYMMKTLADTDMCLIRLCNLPGSREITITYICSNVETIIRHYFDPTDFSSNVNQYLLTEEELENQKIVRDSCECAGFT